MRMRPKPLRQQSVVRLAFRLSLGGMALFLLFSSGVSAATFRTVPKNVIIFIGDGMGFEQVKAGGLFTNGQIGSLSFEQFPHQSKMTTRSADNSITDSAASATAMATGHKVNNGVISQQWPGDGSNLSTLLEYYKSKGRRTGLVTTSDITDATPAAFGAHQSTRNNRAEIASDYLQRSRPNVLFGANLYMNEANAKSAGYTVVKGLADLNALDLSQISYLSGQFRNYDYMEWEYRRLANLVPDQPSLSTMTSTALEILNNNPNGFFLLVENELTDEIGHRSELTAAERTMRLVFEVRELSNAVNVALNWAKDRDDTLIIVAADHETGGFKLLTSTGQANVVPSKASWSTNQHTSVQVPVYAWGAGAGRATEVTDNSGMFNFGSPQIAPIPTLQPSSIAVNENEAATLSITVDGTDPFTFRWQKNGHDIPGATTSLYVTPPLTKEDAGATFQCIVANTIGETASQSVAVSVRRTTPPIMGQSVGTPVPNPGNVKLQGGAKGFLNPSINDVARLHFNATGPGSVRWELFDREGHEVQSVTKETPGNTPDALEWNGSNENGTSVAPGLYFYRLEGPGLRTMGKIVVID